MPVIPLQPTPESETMDTDPFENLRAGFEADRQAREKAQQQALAIEGGAGVSVDASSGGRYTISRIGEA